MKWGMIILEKRSNKSQMSNSHKEVKKKTKWLIYLSI